MTGDIEDRAYAVFSGDGSSSLEGLCRGLLAEQRVAWPEFKRAHDSLSRVRSRDIECDGFSVRLVFNPGRAVNTTAVVTPEEVKARPCFLCPANLPVEQKGIAYRAEFLILANPRPAVPFHLTIAHIDHRPQSLHDHADMFLQIAADLGSGFTVLYNGPRCGASAPDHLHFQAVPSGEMPVEKELRGNRVFAPLRPQSDAGPVPVLRAAGLGREVIVIEASDAPGIAAALADYTRALEEATASPGQLHEEPMMNAAVSFDGNAWRLLVFPRRTHRPAAFYREDEGKIMVSPAVMEMAGIIVTPAERDFDRLDAAAIESIYREVSYRHDGGSLDPHPTAAR